MGRLRQTEESGQKGSIEFWRKLWSEPVEHKRVSQWLKNVKEKLRDTTKQDDVETVDKYILRSTVWTFALPGIIAK